MATLAVVKDLEVLKYRVSARVLHRFRSSSSTCIRLQKVSGALIGLMLQLSMWADGSRSAQAAECQAATVTVTRQGASCSSGTASLTRAIHTQASPTPPTTETTRSPVRSSPGAPYFLKVYGLTACRGEDAERRRRDASRVNEACPAPAPGRYQGPAADSSTNQ